MKFPKLLLLLYILAFFQTLKAQRNFGFTDGRDVDPTCIKAANIINSKPKEVLFGIRIQPSGEVYLSMNNKEWFNKIFTVANCISADIVSKEKYDCANYRPSAGLFRGYVMPPLFKFSFKQNIKEEAGGGVYMKLGMLPAGMLNKQLEGNLIIACDRRVCYYAVTIDIDRAVWQLLPMGLYADTIMQAPMVTDTTTNSLFTYTRKVQVTVPFLKGKTTYNKTDLKPVYDSLNLGGYDIKKIEILAYASVEGLQVINEDLMHKRAQAMVDAFKQYQPAIDRYKITAAENWVDFFQDIKATPLRYLDTLSKQGIKARLMDKAVQDTLKDLLSAGRKAIVTIYLDTKSEARQIPAAGILQIFTNAVKANKIPLARAIQKEIIERVADNALPEEYIDKLEVPLEKNYFELFNDREVYKYQLKLTDEYQALQAFEQIRLADTTKGKVDYNICALRLMLCQYGNTALDKQALLAKITQLAHKDIDASLVKRLLINYHIIICAEYNQAGKYAAKDSMLFFIKNNYSSLKLTDEDRLSLAKYFAFYMQKEWSMEVISPRIGQVDVSEDIVFYYLNLLFFQPDMSDSEIFKKAALNAINLNRKRYCRFFNSINDGGASMQLLEHDVIRKIYCDNCQH